MIEKRKASFDKPLKSCQLCGSSAIVPYHRDFKGRNISRCIDCGIQFLNPQYSDSFLKRYYADYSREDAAWEEPLNYCHHHYLSLIERHVSPGSLLDIGSGEGHLLRAACQRGWRGEGYEIDAKLAGRTAAKLGLKVRHGRFSALPLARGSLDLVSMHNVLEHVKDPSLYLDKSRSLLKRAGILFLVLPNVRSRSSALKFLLERLGLRRRRVGSYYDADHHLWYFTPRVARRELTRRGFKVLCLRSGHAARPGQSPLKRAWCRNVGDLLPWKSTFLLIARKT